MMSKGREQAAYDCIKPLPEQVAFCKAGNETIEIVPGIRIQNSNQKEIVLYYAHAYFHEKDKVRDLFVRTKSDHLLEKSFIEVATKIIDEKAASGYWLEIQFSKW